MNMHKLDLLERKCTPSHACSDVDVSGSICLKLAFLRDHRLKKEERERKGCAIATVSTIKC